MDLHRRKGRCSKVMYSEDRGGVPSCGCIQIAGFQTIGPEFTNVDEKPCVLNFAHCRGHLNRPSARFLAKVPLQISPHNVSSCEKSILLPQSIGGQTHDRRVQRRSAGHTDIPRTKNRKSFHRCVRRCSGHDPASSNGSRSPSWEGIPNCRRHHLSKS